MSNNLGDDSIVIVDLRGEGDYAAGHIPGAVQLAAKPTFQEVDENGVPGMLPAAGHVASALSELGVDAGSTVVFYDGSTSLWSARALWAMDVYGHGDTRLLDGAWAHWSASGFDTSTTPVTPAASTYIFKDAPNTSLIASWEEVVIAINDPAKIVCDVRTPEEYAGEDVRSDFVGHVPGAVNVNWNRTVNADGEFLPVSELRLLYEGEGIEGDIVVFTMCQSGVRASHSWFVLHELLGYESVKVYDGSWHEWGNRDDLPITTEG
ncbi:MAG: sulfurtransferase [Dehalococcoidia bacterium]|nr:sulfurtransferase [Dehalococcoidia bacterium]